MDELIMDDALAVRKTSSITFPLSLLTQNFLHRGGGSDDFHSEDCHFVCASYRKHHVLSPEIMLFFVFISHIDEVTKNSRVSFCSCINIWGTKCWQTRQMFNTSWRILWQLLTEILPFDVVWFTDFLLSLLTIYYRCSTFASFVDVDGRPLRGSSSMVSRPSWERLCQSYTWEFFIALSLHAYCNIVDVSACDLCSKIQNLLFVRCWITGIFNSDATLYTLNKQLLV